MNSEIAMIVSGFLFWWIIITNIVSGRFGYQTINELGPEAKLQQISQNPKWFKIGFTLIIIEHISIIALAVTLFIAFISYSFLLAIIWLTFRVIEGLVQIYYKQNYWGLFNLSKLYSSASGVEKNTLVVTGSSILKTKSSVFSYTQILFSIGTLAYSILFVTYGVVHVIIGWFGIVAGAVYGLGNVAFMIKPDFKVLWNIGGLLILLFEIGLGGWLIINTLITY